MVQLKLEVVIPAEGQRSNAAVKDNVVMSWSTYGKESGWASSSLSSLSGSLQNPSETRG